jgi:hypothetical protein
MAARQADPGLPPKKQPCSNAQQPCNRTGKLVSQSPEVGHLQAEVYRMAWNTAHSSEGRRQKHEVYRRNSVMLKDPETEIQPYICIVRAGCARTETKELQKEGKAETGRKGAGKRKQYKRAGSNVQGREWCHRYMKRWQGIMRVRDTKAAMRYRVQHTECRRSKQQ